MARTRRSVEQVVGARIKALREQKAMTQAALARGAHTSQSNIARIEAGERSATLGSLVKIAKALKVDLPKLLEKTVTPSKPAKAEKVWYRVCDRLRDQDEHFLRGVEHLIKALQSARE